jgi:hypothetical protein
VGSLGGERARHGGGGDQVKEEEQARPRICLSLKEDETEVSRLCSLLFGCVFYMNLGLLYLGLDWS